MAKGPDPDAVLDAIRVVPGTPAGLAARDPADKLGLAIDPDRVLEIAAHAVVHAAFAFVFAEDRAALVGPARHRAAEVVGKYGVRNLVRQDAG